MKGFRILSTILVLANFCKSAWGQRPLAGIEVTLKKFSWTFEKGQVSDLTVCAGNALGSLEDENVYSLSYRVDGSFNEESYDDGILNDPDTTCVSFSALAGHDFVNDGVTYTLTVTDTNNDVVHYGDAHFAVQTEVLTRNCGDAFPLYYRIDAGADAVFDEDCLVPSDAGHNVCYKDNSAGELTDMTICYTDVNNQPPDLTICQTGLEVNGDDAIGTGEALQIDYLGYGEDSTTATLMLGTEEISEVFVVAGTSPTNKPAMCISYADGLCTIDNFEPKNIEYSVCGLVAAGTDDQLNSVNTIEDFDVFIYADTDLLLDFGFANANTDVWWYTASLLKEPQGEVVEDVTPVTIDCTKVDPKHNCYGFLVVDKLGAEGNFYLEVYYNNENGNQKSNTVVVPHIREPLIAITAEPPETKIN